jgi:hypothetical protein
MGALFLLRNKAINPILAAARLLHPLRGAQLEAIDAHHHAIRVAVRGVFYEHSDLPLDHPQIFAGLRPEARRIRGDAWPSRTFEYPTATFLKSIPTL